MKKYPYSARIPTQNVEGNIRVDKLLYSEITLWLDADSNVMSVNQSDCTISEYNNYIYSDICLWHQLLCHKNCFHSASVRHRFMTALGEDLRTVSTNPAASHILQKLVIITTFSKPVCTPRPRLTSAVGERLRL